jgi:hypothetical protein
MSNFIYKLRHIPTGLFYRPLSDNNLSKFGKVYKNKAINYNVVSVVNTLSNIASKNNLAVRVNKPFSNKYCTINTLPEDWEWVIYQYVEVNTENIKE